MAAATHIFQGEQTLIEGFGLLKDIKKWYI